VRVAMNEANTHAEAMGPAGETLDQAHERLGHTAPRVSLADLEANIVNVEILKHRTYGGQVLRWAIITTRNGFAVVGDPSASVSPENDSQELGEKFALENSKRALWPLMGYALRERLATPPLVYAGDPVDEVSLRPGAIRQDER
jgi:hypothetical protein